MKAACFLVGIMRLPLPTGTGRGLLRREKTDSGGGGFSAALLRMAVPSSASWEYSEGREKGYAAEADEEAPLIDEPGGGNC
jgi:hypothetical protein